MCVFDAVALNMFANQQPSGTCRILRNNQDQSQRGSRVSFAQNADIAEIEISQDAETKKLKSRQRRRGKDAEADRTERRDKGAKARGSEDVPQEAEASSPAERHGSKDFEVNNEAGWQHEP